jgi:hypothetical protein
LGGVEGDLDSLNISDQILWQAVRNEKAIDCTWVISTDEGKRVFLQIEEYQLEQPNDCTHNVVEIYKSTAELEGRSGKPKELCGSQAENIRSEDNILAVRIKTMVSKKSMADSKKKFSRFAANYTIFRNTSGELRTTYLDVIHIRSRVKQFPKKIL